MKSLLVFVFTIFGFTVNATKVAKETPVANAGPNQTIYLTQTSSVTLDGSGSFGEKYEWTDVSTDYKSGATIASPNSLVTTVTGLKQGVWYFQLAATSAGVTATDIVVIKVDYDAPPANGTLIHHFDFVDNAPVIDKRDDTTTFFPVSNYQYSQTNGDSNGDDWFYFRDRTNGLYVDQEKGKLVTTIEDGYQGNAGYARGEVQLADYSFTIDTMHTYVFEWKGYYPQDINYLIGSPSWHTILNMFQIHSYRQTATVYSYGLTADDSIHLSDTYDDGTGNLKTFQKYVDSRSDFYDNAHTIRVTVREGKGYPGQTAFIKSEIDGVANYYRNTGQVGSSYFDDFVKFAGLYDYNHFVVNVDSIARGRKFKLVTEAFNIYQMSNNQFPIANAGSDQTITLPNNNIMLLGSGKDPDGTIASYQWSQISGPPGVTINNVNSSSTAVNGLTQGVYQFQIKVTDNQGATAIATTQITVTAATNKAPVADAGSDQTVTLPKDSVSLSGSGSDSDGTIGSYLWKQIAGTTATITNSSSAAAAVKRLIQGSYQFELTVTDDKGATGKDTVKITVNPAIANKAPVADAGSDQTVTLPKDSVSLSGSGSDSDGTIGSYLWKQIAGTTATITNSSSAAATVKELIQGSYQFELTVTDDKGATGKDTVKVTVNPAIANKAPIADAGLNQTITLPTNSVTLSGVGTDSDGSISSYLWTEISGNTVTITNNSSASARVNGLIEGSYNFELTVTDDKGAIGKDTLQITVKAATSTTITTTSVNKEPTASAGEDKAITLPKDSLQLTGSGSDVDGKIVSYAWTKVAGPSSFSLANSSSAIASVSNLVEGTYKFQLEVTDDKGAIGKDTVQLTVHAANAADSTTTTTSVNKEPTASAGEDKAITLPKDSLQLTGSGSDVDGKIVSYAWTKVAGPSSFSLANSSSAIASVSNLVEGTYKFQLEVTDDRGTVGTDTMQVIVHAAPTSTNTNPVKATLIANAGSDITIVSPNNSVNLSSDTSAEIKSYAWIQLSGPSVSTIKNPDSSVTKVTALIAGTYEYELKVTDDNGNKGIDTVTVTVALPRFALPSSNLSIYPNPVHSVATLEVTTPQENTNVSILITNISGRIVYKKHFVSNSVHVSEQIDMSNLIKGVYVVSVFFDGTEMQSMKVIRL